MRTLSEVDAAVEKANRRFEALAQRNGPWILSAIECYCANTELKPEDFDVKFIEHPRCMHEVTYWPNRTQIYVVDPQFLQTALTRLVETNDT